MDHYQHLKRQCVFSHEELVCKMAAEPERLDVNLAAATHQDMLSMVEAEKKHRKRLFDLVSPRLLALFTQTSFSVCDTC